MTKFDRSFQTPYRYNAFEDVGRKMLQWTGRPSNVSAQIAVRKFELALSLYVLKKTSIDIIMSKFYHFCIVLSLRVGTVSKSMFYFIVRFLYE